jgi:phage-related protein
VSDTAVVFSVLAKDRASKVFRNIANSARTSSSSIVAALGPALTPVLASATAGVVGLGAALGGAGAAIGVFGAVTKTAFTEMQEASQKSDDLREKIALLTEQAKVAEKTGLADAGKIEAARDKAITELMARYNQMPPALRKVTMAYDGMKSSWKGFVDQNKPAVYAVMTSGFSSLTAIIPKLQPLFDMGAAAAQRLVAWLARITASGGIDRFVAFLSQQAGPALDNLGTIARNMGITLGAAFRSTAPAGQGMLAWLTQLSEKAAAFAQGGGFERFMAYVNGNGPGVVTLLSSLASTVGVLYQAVSPLAPVSLAVAGALAQIIAATPPGVITALVGAWIAYSVAMKAHAAATTVSGVAMALWGKRTALAGVYAKATAASQWLLNAAVTAGAWARNTAMLAGFLAKQALIAVATKAWAAAQWLLNVAMSMNPIGLVVIAVVALIAIIALLWVKSAAFRNFWIAVWGAIKTHALAVWTDVKARASAFWTWVTGAAAGIRNRFVGAWTAVKNGAATAWNWIRSKVSGFYNWITSLPGKISSKLAGMWEGLKSGFRSAVNWVIGKMRSLNFTIGGGSFMGVSVPQYSVGFGNIPYLAKGGNVMRDGAAVVGERGPELVSLNRGAQVTPLTGGGRGVGGVITLRLEFGDSILGRAMASAVRTQTAVRSELIKHLRIQVV